MVRSLSLVVTLLLISNIASAQNRFRPSGSEDACKADSHRFCQDVFPPQRELPPDQFKMLSCLQEHRAKLSKACNEMLKGHGV